MLTADFHESGPLFDGRAEAELARYSNLVADVLGQEAVDRIRTYLPTQYKYLGNNGGTPQRNPVPANAGYLQSQIHTEGGGGLVIVTDTPVVYGPWIEGVSSRNDTTRFKGYHAFRLIGQQLEAEATLIAERELPPFLAAVNG